MYIYIYIYMAEMSNIPTSYGQIAIAQRRATWVYSSAAPWLQGAPRPLSPPRRSSRPMEKAPWSPATPRPKSIKKMGKPWENVGNPNFGGIE